MLKTLVINNLRGIQHLELKDLKRINLFVGKNNSSKTTILDSIFLSLSPLNPPSLFTIEAFRGVEGFEPEHIRNFFYNLELKKPIILNTQFDEPFQQRGLVINPILNNVLPLQNKTTTLNSKFLSNSTEDLTEDNSLVNGAEFEFSFTKIGNKRNDPEKFTTTWTINQGNMQINQNGSGSNQYKEDVVGIYISSRVGYTELGARLNELQIKKEVPSLIKVIQKVEPSIVDLKLGANNTILCDIGLDRLLPINVMGDGIIKMLHILLAMYKVKRGILLIDEIENGLHYSAQSIIWQAIIEFAIEFDVQIFATSHSQDCVRAFNEVYFQSSLENYDATLFRIEKRGQNFNVVSYDPDSLRVSLTEGWEIR